MNPQVSVLIESPRIFNSSEIISEELNIRDNIDLSASMVVMCLINTRNISDLEIIQLTKSHLERNSFTIQTRTAEGKFIKDIIWDISVNDMVIKITYTVKMFYGEEIFGTIKKCVCRFPKDNSYENLFKEMGVNDDSIDVAIMSAKLKIQETIKKSII